MSIEAGSLTLSIDHKITKSLLTSFTSAEEQRLTASRFILSHISGTFKALESKLMRVRQSLTNLFYNDEISNLNAAAFNLHRACKAETHTHTHTIHISVPISEIHMHKKLKQTTLLCSKLLSSVLKDWIWGRDLIEC